MQSQDTHTTAPSDPWREHYATAAGLRHWPCEALVRVLAGRSAVGAALEVGCGNGANLWFLAEHAAVVTGVDGNQGALDMARDYMKSRGCQRVVLLNGDALRLPVHDMSQDLVVDVMLGQHVPWDHYEVLLAEYRRVLKPGGTLFRHNLAPGTTLDDGIQVGRYTYDQLPKLFPGVGPVCIPSDEALAGALTKAGFSVRSTIHMSREYQGGYAVARYGSLVATRI